MIERGAGDVEVTLTRAMTMHAAVLQRAAERILGCPLCGLSGDLERTELVHLLEAALQSLPESLRVVFLLRELEGYPYDRIARRLGMPLDTIRSRLNRARRVVRAWISEASARARSRAEIALASLACSTPRGRTANLRVETVTCTGPVRRTSCSISRARTRETR